MAKSSPCPTALDAFPAAIAAAAAAAAVDEDVGEGAGEAPIMAALRRWL